MMEFSKQRAILYNLQPFNIGQGLVESISSFLIRLSEAHNVDVGVLINKIIIPRLDKDYLNRGTKHGGNSFYKGSKTLNSFSENALNIVNVLEELIGRDDLKQLTLLDFSEVFSNRNLLKGELSWCPKCLKDLKEENKLFYPLIWNFSSVKVCIKHECLIRNTCENCFKKNPLLKYKVRLGYCSSCENPLFETNVTESIKLSKDQTEWYEFCFRNIEFILVDRLSEFKVVQFLNGIFTEKFASNLGSFAKATSIPKSTLLGWLNGNNIPTLEGILKVCFNLKIDLSCYNKDIYINVEIKHNPLGTRFEKQIIVRKPINFNQIEGELNRILSKEVPISMTSAANEIGRNKRVLYYHFPELCKAISERYLIHKKNLANERIELLQEEIKLTFFNLLSENIFPSRAAIEKRLGKPGILRESKLKSFWNDLINSEVTKNDG